MEKLITEIEAYAASVNKSPAQILREAINAGGGQWASWRDGRSSPTLRVVDRLRKYMADHPAPLSNQEDAA